MNSIEFANTELDQLRFPVKITLPASMGNGFVSRDSFQSGLQLRVIKTKFDDLTEVKYNSIGYSVGVGFLLSGSFESKSSCFKKSFDCKLNMSGFFFYPEISDICMKVDCSPMEYAAIVMDTETMAGLMQDATELSLPVIKKMEKGQPFILSDALTSSMRMVFYQIFSCPFTGKIREIFLEGKLMELLAYKLYQLHTGKACIRQAPKLTSGEIERIRFAADLLTRDLENPPDMTTIASAAGLSKSTLYRNFNKVFNMSPCGYLRDQRLHAAMQLLKSGEVNVTEAAFLVGYSSLSHFAKAFKSVFGVQPSEFMNNPT